MNRLKQYQAFFQQHYCEEDAPEWIPISERLPEGKALVLIKGATGPYRKAHLTSRGWRLPSPHKNGGAELWPLADATHWKPIL